MSVILIEHGITPENIPQQLILTGQFLALSRTHSHIFTQAIRFSLENATEVHIIAPGIICFEPAHFNKKDIVLSCGVHGNETAPIEICDTYVQHILRGEIQLAHRVLFLFGNLPAMDVAQRFIEENMNRLFSGAHTDESSPPSAERARAKLLEDAVADFYTKEYLADDRQRYHYDLHTAIRSSKNDKFAVYPFRHAKPWDKNQLQILLACGVNTILLSGSATTTFSYFSSNEFGAQAFTVELGKVKPFGQNDMRQFSQVELTLKRLMCGEDLHLMPYDPDDFFIYKVNQIINKQHADFELKFADDAPNFSDFARGEVLATEPGQVYVAEYEGEAIVFPNAKVEIGQRA
ncbi:MAG: succinylglutamate desuccinylase, partial [Paraglaciecola sp.]